MSDAPQGTITRLLGEIAGGNKDSEQTLFDLVYQEIHAAARRLLERERRGQSWQATDFVGEVYLRLFARGSFVAPNRSYFFGAVARAMRQALIDHARRRRPEHMALDKMLSWLQTEQHLDIADFSEALAELERLNPRHHRVVLQRVFLGRSMDEIAQDERCSKSTIEKDWAFARAWLRQRLAGYEHGS